MRGKEGDLIDMVYSGKLYENVLRKAVKNLTGLRGWFLSDETFNQSYGRIFETGYRVKQRISQGCKDEGVLSGLPKEILNLEGKLTEELSKRLVKNLKNIPFR